MYQVSERRLLFENEELTVSKCIESVNSMVETYNHSTEEQRKAIEQRFHKYYPWLADSLVSLCKNGIAKSKQQDLINFLISDRSGKCLFASLQYIADGTLK